MLAEPDLMSAKTLLHKYLDLLSYSPDVAGWTEAAFEPNPPRFHRLKRLQSLFAAFGLAWDIPAFREGQFIDGSARYDPVRERAIAESPRGRADLSRQSHEQYLRDFFEDLLGYRERIDRVLNYHSGVYAASGYYAYACALVNEANASLRQAVEPIEDLLAACISPTWQTFPRAQLIRDFGYSDVDLFDIDADWA